MRQVVLVFGSPCAGKSTFVQENAQPGDLIVDFDHLAEQLGSPVTHDHAPQFIEAASRARDQLEARIAQTPDIRAWVIRSGGRASTMRRLSQRLQATRVVVLDPGPGVCLARARAAGRSPLAMARIVTWYQDRDAALNAPKPKGGRRGRY